MSVTIESERQPTTKSAAFDPIFPDLILAHFFFGTSSVVQRLSRKASNSLECYSGLTRDHTKTLRFAMCSQSSQVVKRSRLEGELFFRNEFKRPLGGRIKGSRLRIYRELFSKEFMTVYNFPENV